MYQRHSINSKSFSESLKAAIEKAREFGRVAIAVDNPSPAIAVCEGLGLNYANLHELPSIVNRTLEKTICSGGVEESSSEKFIIVKPLDVILSDCDVVITFQTELIEKWIKHMHVVGVNDSLAPHQHTVKQDYVQFLSPVTIEHVVGNAISSRELLLLLEGSYADFYASHVLGVRRPFLRRGTGIGDMVNYLAAGGDPKLPQVLVDYARGHLRNALYNYYQSGVISGINVQNDRIHCLCGSRILRFCMVSSMPNYISKTIKREISINALIAKNAGLDICEAKVVCFDGRIVSEFDVEIGPVADEISSLLGSTIVVDLTRI